MMNVRVKLVRVAIVCGVLFVIGKQSTASPEASGNAQNNSGSNPAITFVDMNRAFKEYNKTKDAEAKINDAKSQAKKEYDGRANAYKKALDEINAVNKQLESATLSADAKSGLTRQRDDKIINIKQMEKNITDFRTTRERQLQEQALRLRTEIVANIRARMDSLDNHASNLIFDTGGNSLNGAPVVLFSPSAANMTNNVIAALNGGQESAFSSTQDSQLGVVDMNRVFGAYNKTKEASAKINEDKSAAQKEYNAREETHKKAVDAFNILNTKIRSGGMSQEAKQKLVKDVGDLSAKANSIDLENKAFKAKRDKEVQDHINELRGGILAEITKTISIGLQGSNTALVFDVSGNGLNGVPVVMYSKGLPDFSTDVISNLNQAKGTSRFGRLLKSSRMLRFAVVDANRALKENPETKKSAAIANDAKNQAKKEYDDRADAYKKALDEVNSLNKQLESSGLTADAKSRIARERDDKITTIKEMENDITDFRTAREKELQHKDMSMREPIVASLKKAVNELAEKEHFNVVFDSSGNSLNGVTIVLNARDVPDLTNEVIARFSGTAR
jgi:outer membrane protein